MAEFRSAMKWRYGDALYELADDRLDPAGYLVFRQANRPDGPKVHISPETFSRAFVLEECPMEQKVFFRKGAAR